MTRPSIAILDDTQNVARASADWSALEQHADITVFRAPFADEDEAAQLLAPFPILIPMRERTAFTGSLIRRLPNLRLIAMTGRRAPSLDLAACTAQGVLVCNTGINTSAPTSELAFGLILAVARAIPLADATLRGGGWHYGVPLGTVLEGRTLGIVGLGNLGGRVARFGQAFGMNVIAWSQNLTAETAAASNVKRVEKAELFATSDVISVHLVLSERTRGIIGRAELEAMRPGAILINTARGPLIDEGGLLDALQSGRIRAGLDVFNKEPLPEDHPLRRLPNVVLTPHLGYAEQTVFELFYRESVENVLAFLKGAPIRMVNPEAAQGIFSPT